MNWLDSKYNLYIGRWLGTPVYLHWLWMLFMAVVMWTNPSFALLFAGVFLLVLLHELGHCAATRYFGKRVDKVILLPIGGVAAVEIARNPFQETVVALAGPAVNAVFIPVFWALQLVFPGHPLLDNVAHVNTLLLLFNLIPALPMDGGRVLRAALYYFMNDYIRATTLAARCSQVMCAALGGLALMSMNLNLLLIGVFVFYTAEQEIAQARRKVLYDSLTDASEAEMLQTVEEELEELERRYK